MDNSTDNSTENFIPKHLLEATTEDLKSSISSTSVVVEDNAKLKEEYSFHLKWISKNGEVYEGDFVNKILSIREQGGVGVLRAKLANNTPIESLDAFTVKLNLMVAHLTFSLKEKPKWCSDLRELRYVELLETIYEEVASHEAIFLGY